MPFNKEDHIMIKSFYLIKGYTTQKLLKEYPSKSWMSKVFVDC